MASLHKDPRGKSKYWYAAYTGPDGKRYFRSTKQIDHKLALGVAVQWQRAVDLARRQELTEDQSRSILNDILKLTNTGDQFRAPQTGAWLREWLAAKAADMSDGATARYGGVIEAFIAHLGPRAERPLASIAAREVQAFIAARRKAGCSPTTVVTDAKILRTALNAARRQGLLQSNVAEAVDLPTKKGVERGTFSTIEVKMLVDAAEGEWKTLILTAYFTGARLTDCCNMEWSAIDLCKGCLSYVQGKTGKAVTLPLHPDYMAHLEMLAGTDHPEQFVMPHMAGLKPGGRHGLSEGFKRIVLRAGLDLQTVQGGGKRRLSRRTFHALRHSFTSALANAGVNPELRMKLTGHTTEAVHRGYTHHELETLRQAVNKLPSLSPATTSPQ